MAELNLNLVNLFHVLLVGPLLMYVGYLGQKTPEWLSQVLLVTGALVMATHVVRYWNRRSTESVEVVNDVDMSSNVEVSSNDVSES